MAKKQKEIKLPKVEILPSGNRRVRATINGKVESFTAPTDEEVITMYLVAKQNQEKEKKPKKKEYPTLSDAMRHYIDIHDVPGAESTVRGYMIIYRNAFRELMQKKLDEITKDDLQKCVTEDAQNGLSPKTIKNRIALIRPVFRYYELPFPKLIAPSESKSVEDTEEFVRFLDDEELSRFCKAIRGNEEYELMCYLALNGLRRSELYALTYDSINLKTGKITVSGAVVPDKDNQYIRKDKNKNRTSKRITPILFPRIIELVEAADKTKPITSVVPSTFFRFVNNQCLALGMNEIGIHGLRHTGASLCVYRKVDKRAIMHWFGWSNPETLDKIYSHISARQRSLEAEKVTSFTKDL